MHSVLITGATGFLGSHIAEVLCKNDIKVIALRRVTSDLWRCAEFADKIDWINLDQKGEWKEEVIALAPSEIIHCAWIGVESNDRDNWMLQAKNIEFLVNILEITKRLKIKKFIFLGSQAEYGNIGFKVTEDQVVNPVNAYASIKLCCLQILSNYATINKFNWVWLRVFSVFGERESQSWLIPSLIRKLEEETEMNFTKGDQQYAYLYAEDFGKILLRIVRDKVGSGIYNVSANNTLTLKSLISKIRDAINPSFRLNFGVIPYRENQSMHIEGDISKLIAEIGMICFTDFNVALQNTINHFKSK